MVDPFLAGLHAVGVGKNDRGWTSRSARCGIYSEVIINETTCWLHEPALNQCNQPDEETVC